MKKLVVLLAMLASGNWAFGQTNCADYNLKVYQNGQEIDMKNSPLFPSLNLVLVNDSSCTATAICQLKRAELSLLRGTTLLLPTIKTDKPEVDLTEFKKVYQPGDRLVIEVEGSPMDNNPEAEQNEDAVSYSVVVNWPLQ